MELKDYILIGVVFFGMVLVAASTGGASQMLSGVTGGSLRDSCSVATSTRVFVTNSASGVVLPAYSNRAWATIQQPVNATNTVALSFDEGAAAVIGSGFQLSNGIATTSVHSVSIGLATDLPYTGAVTAITSTGASTLLITECIY